jgi:hypothetical protein
MAANMASVFSPMVVNVTNGLFTAASVGPPINWYHQGEGQPNIARGDLEFGFIFSAASHCEAGYSLGGKAQNVGEMIIASLKAP